MVFAVVAVVARYAFAVVLCFQNSLLQCPFVVAAVVSGVGVVGGFGVVIVV